MSGITKYFAKKLLDHGLRGDVGGTSFTQLSSVYLALYTANPGDEGASGTEVSGGGYARNLIKFGPTTDGVMANSTTPLFNLPACTVSHYALWDASSGGNCLFAGSLATPQVFNSGDTFQPQAGALKISRVVA